MKISSCKRYSKIVITLVVLLFLIGTAGLSYSYCPDPHLSLEKEYASSAVVFVGKVLSERSTVESDGFYEGITYTLQVEEIFRSSVKIVAGGFL